MAKLRWLLAIALVSAGAVLAVGSLDRSRCFSGYIDFSTGRYDSADQAIDSFLPGKRESLTRREVGPHHVVYERFDGAKILTTVSVHTGINGKWDVGEVFGAC